MLHEILKGMDNAAEQINENFQELAFDSGSNNDGYWVKYPDGTMVCRGRVIYDKSNSERQSYDYPQTFVDGPSLSITVYSGRFNDLQDAGNINFGTSVNQFQLAKDVNRPFLETSTMNMEYTAIGTWK